MYCCLCAARDQAYCDKHVRGSWCDNACCVLSAQPYVYCKLTLMLCICLPLCICFLLCPAGSSHAEQRNQFPGQHAPTGLIICYTLRACIPAARLVVSTAMTALPTYYCRHAKKTKVSGRFQCLVLPRCAFAHMHLSRLGSCSLARASSRAMIVVETVLLIGMGCLLSSYSVCILCLQCNSVAAEHVDSRACHMHG